jgi:hypothetical protein
MGDNQMSTKTLEIEGRHGRIRGRDSRTQSVATRFAGAEKQALLKKAEANGQTLLEWTREVLPHSDAMSGLTEMQMHIFTGLVGIQMRLMGTLEPLLCNDKIAQDQLTILSRQVQTTKAAKAQELLAKRSQKEEN